MVSMTPAELASQLRPALLRLTRLIRNQRVDMSVTLTQLSALATLRKHGPMSAGELAGVERVQPPSMTKVLALLEDRGLVTRQPHPSDRRQAIIVLAQPGIDLLDSERRSRDAWLSRRLAELTRGRASVAALRRPGARQAGRAVTAVATSPARLTTDSPDAPPPIVRAAADRNVPVAAGPELSALRRRATRLAHRDLDAAGRPGLARSRAHQLRHRARHRHGAAVPALVAVRAVGRRAR